MKVIATDGDGHTGDLFEWTQDREDVLKQLGIPYEICELKLADTIRYCPNCDCTISLEDI